jgi:xanthine dehydrogenase YagR molybdenum-binding subunit
VQRIRIGTTKDGRITAIGHESWSGDLPDGKADGAVAPTRMLYAGSNRMTATKLAVLDLPEGNAMRAPGEATGMMALEVAIDEMAEKLGIDPIEFRILNDTQVVPDHPQPAASQNPQVHADAQTDKQPNLPFSQRQLVKCFRVGAKRFGWSSRNPQPGQIRDGRWMIGIGTAAAFRNNQLTKSGARVTIEGELITHSTTTPTGLR